MLNQIAAIHGTGAAAGGGTSYESIATTIVGSGGSAGVTFSSIPSTYKHLQLRILAKYSANSDIGIQSRFNGDSGNNYVQYHQLYGTGAAAVSAAGNTPFTEMEFLYLPGTNRNASTFAGYVIDILDYADTNKYKTVRNLNGFDDNGAGFVIYRSHLWMSTSAVNSISFTPPSNSLSQYSSFALYGIKG